MLAEIGGGDSERERERDYFNVNGTNLEICVVEYG